MRCNALSVVLVALACAENAFGADPIAPKIGPVALGDNRPKVESLLGKPARVVSTGDALDPELQYAEFSVWLWDRVKVAQLRSTNPKYCLADVVCPGAAAVTASKLGHSQQGPMDKDGIYTYLVAAEACWAEVTIEAEKVSMVAIKCQP